MSEKKLFYLAEKMEEKQSGVELINRVVESYKELSDLNQCYKVLYASCLTDNNMTDKEIWLEYINFLTKILTFLSSDTIYNNSYTKKHLRENSDKYFRILNNLALDKNNLFPKELEKIKNELIGKLARKI